MKRLPDIILSLLAVLMLSWFLPWLYALLTPSASNTPFCSFSPISQRWVVSQTVNGEKPIIIMTDSVKISDGNRYLTEGTTRGNSRRLTVSDRDSLVPQLYYRQLAASEKLPDTITGIEITQHILRSNELFLNASPRDVNKVTPGIWLMMESMPDRVDLSDPEEAFRFTKDGIEFINISDNSINTDRSRRFTRALQSQGFITPAMDLSANITSRKAYDEGYLMIDADGKPFHIKQQGGRPWVSAINLPEGVKASKIMITEENDRSVIGLLTDIDNNLYIILREGHKAIKLRGDDSRFDPSEEALTLMGSVFGLTVKITGKDRIRWRHYSRNDYHLLGSIDFPVVRSEAYKVAKWIFPWTLSFVSTYDSLAYPRFSAYSLLSLPMNILLAIILFFLARRRRQNYAIALSLVTIAGGIFTFIPAILLHE